MLVEELTRLSLFQGLKPEHLQRLAPLFHHAAFPAGAHVFAQGDEASDIYVLESGEVRIEFYPSDGGCLNIATIVPGGFFGWSAALGRPRYTSSAVCTAGAAVLVAEGEQLRAVMRADAELGAVLLERMAQVVASRLDGLRSLLLRTPSSDSEAGDQEL